MSYKIPVVRDVLTQRRYVMPPSNKIYDLYIRKTRQMPQTVDLGHGALGHWVGDKNADNVLVWYHGESQLSST